MERTTLFARVSSHGLASHCVYAPCTAVLPSTCRTAPATSPRAARPLREVMKSVQFIAGYIASIRCLLTTKIVFVAVGTDAGREPWFAAETASVRAGQFGRVGGGVVWMRSTYGSVLVEPL